MTDLESNSTDSDDETSDEHREALGLEPLTRDEEWNDEAFRDAGEATFWTE